MGFVVRCNVFTRTGGLCVLLSNGISLEFPHLGSRSKEFS